MPDSPYTGLDDATLRLEIKLDGLAMKDHYAVQSVYVNHCINKISFAELVLVGEVDLSTNTIEITDSEDLNPGKKIVINAGYGSGSTPVFTGVIVKHTVELNSENYYLFRILCKHEAVTLTYNQKEAYFTKMKDSDIITSITGKYPPGFSVEETASEYENMYQKMATDWDFILSRCDFNGFIVCLDQDPVKIGKPELEGAPVLKISAGESIMAFDGTLNAEFQPDGIDASAWDDESQALLTSKATEPGVNSQGNIGPRDLAIKLKQEKLQLISTTPMDAVELKAWADSTLLRKRLNAFKGSVRFQGNASVHTGNLITLAGVGAKFNGDAFVSSVIQSIEAGNWTTTVKFGLENKPINQSPGFSFAPATGQLPVMQGLHLATVKKIDADPDKSFRIQIILPSNADTPTETWARLSNFYATIESGAFFLPEVGDEVVVGFFDNDPRYPVILGSLYSKKNTAPYTAEGKNNIKAIITKSKMKLEFDEEKKIVTIETPGKNFIVVSDNDKSIELKDQNSNSIRLGADGIVIDSSKDVKISAKGNISIDAKAKVTVNATADLELNGLNVSATAKVGLTAKGNATAEISASGNTTVKGAIVMIN